ncbi:MAG: NAD(P)-binding domain-containing protein [Pseudomonadota bacterium]
MAELADIGVVGRSGMGANLALNPAGHGFRVASHNHSPDRITKLVGVLPERFVPYPEPQSLQAAIGAPGRCC